MAESQTCRFVSVFRVLVRQTHTDGHFARRTGGYGRFFTRTDGHRRKHGTRTRNDTHGSPEDTENTYRVITRFQDVELKNSNFHSRLYSAKKMIDFRNYDLAQNRKRAQKSGETLLFLYFFT